jgi:ParB/RepB/Spo0J family partition protein
LLIRCAIERSGPVRPKEKEQAYYSDIAVRKIKPSNLNPRRKFDHSKIAELAASFVEYGVIQPIIVFQKDSHFVIVCGERRWRAAKKAKLSKVPAIIHPAQPKNDVAISMALIENMHRQDIDLISESSAIRNLIDKYDWSKAKVAHELGVSSGYIRNRLLLSQYSDVLNNFDNGKISFSEAVGLASIKDNASRALFLERMENGEFENYKAFVEAVGRYKFIKKALEAGLLLDQPLDHSLVQFDTPKLTYCGSACKYYLCLTWEERKHLGLPIKKPGWAEFCTSNDNGCYSKKTAMRQKYLQRLKKAKTRRPIPDDGWESMIWFKYRKKMCRTCNHMVNASDFEQIGMKPEPGIYAYCISSKSNCYDSRSTAYVEKGIKREKLFEAAKERRKKKILNQISKSRILSKKTLGAYLTKRESAYLILQYICYAGGKNRLEDFAKKHSLNKNMPSKFSAQLRYVRNRLIDSITEEKLIEILFVEAASCAAFSPQEIEPLQYHRTEQKEIPIII